MNILLKHLHDAGLPMRKRMMQKNCNGLQHCYRLCYRANEVNTAAHNSDLSDILVYTNCLLSNLLLLCLVKRSAYPTLVTVVCTHVSLSYLSCEQAPVLQLLIASAPIILPEHAASIEMFFTNPPCVDIQMRLGSRRAKGHCCYRSVHGVFSLDTLNWEKEE